MLNRRALCAGLGSGLGISAGFGLGTGAARAHGPALPFYASQGPLLIHYDLDVAGARLTAKAQTVLPANLQYAWPHPSRRFLYVAVSDRGVPGGGATHYAMAFRVGADGQLTEHGPRRKLPVRPIHCCTDVTGTHLLVAFNQPSGLRVFSLNGDGTIGGGIAQNPALDFGTYAHQVRATPSGKTVTLCSRGNDPAPGKPEDPGFIEVYGFSGGRLSALQKLAPHGRGIGFGPRHMDFSPDGRFAFVSVERENQLCVYGMDKAGRLSDEPLFIKSALIDPDGKAKHPGQGVGPIHVGPGGRFVYQTNRGSGTVLKDGKRVSNGGENDIVVWAINPRSGEPSLIQHAPAHAFELRTFAIDPSGTLLLAASTNPLMVEENGQTRTVSAGLSLYRVAPDGRLAFIRKQDVDTRAGSQFWCGLLTMA